MYILNDDNINNICVFIDKHSDLCLLKLVNKNLNNISEKKIKLLYEKEEKIISSILTKIQSNLNYNIYIILIKCKSVEQLKYLLNWNNNDISHITFNFGNGMNNYFVIDIFYCDCNFCHRTEICGRGFTIKLNEEEKKFLNLHFQYDWWNKFD
jgi:hypothetical protein